MQSVELTFDSHGQACAARLHLPGGAKKPPVVVMGHGFGALASFGLEPFAQALAQRGLASLVFDYRHFGPSQGLPRQLISIGRQLRDWRAAMALARSLEAVDGARLGLWGSSFSGGHVVVLAASDPDVAAVVSQAPMVDGLASALLLGPAYAAGGLLHGLWDLARAALGLAPHHAPIVGRPGSSAFLRTPDAFDGYMALVPPGAPWRNQTPARVFLAAAFYRPTARATRVQCPLLVVAAGRDGLIPPAATRKMAAKAPRGQLIELDCGHFEVYVQPTLRQLAVAEADFLARHLL